MRQNIINLALCSLAALSTAAPVERRSINNNVIDEFENIDSFPSPSPQQLLNTEQRAHGTLSNGTPPATVNPDTIISLQVIAAEEQFEAAFFQQLLTNITNNEPGFLIPNTNARTMGINALTAIVAVSTWALGKQTRKRFDVLTITIARGITRPQRNQRPQTLQPNPRRTMPL